MNWVRFLVPIFKLCQNWFHVKFLTIWNWAASIVSHWSQCLSILVGQSLGTRIVKRKVVHLAFFNIWLQCPRWPRFQRMNKSKNRKMPVRKLQNSDNGGVMTKIIGSHTGDQSIHVFKLFKNDISILVVLLLLRLHKLACNDCIEFETRYNVWKFLSKWKLWYTKCTLDQFSIFIFRYTFQKTKKICLKSS